MQVFPATMGIHTLYIWVPSYVLVQSDTFPFALAVYFALKGVFDDTLSEAMGLGLSVANLCCTSARISNCRAYVWYDIWKLSSKNECETLLHS